MNFLTASFSKLYDNGVSFMNSSGESSNKVMRAMTEGIDLNNAAYMAFEKGNYKTSVEKYLKAIEIKLEAYGEESRHICISLSGLCDAYLKLGDIENARKQAIRMLRIANKIEDPEQKRIAREILSDIQKA